ncbi:hypothetical protein LOZ66_005313 [Ophidiomyces ophidiicola]|nr:hypothetical protein LOZ65_002106 [Ophidiomyces ophidiicola]KAI1935426.1 hypothetical protein LOZ66_005313 [Ophidiomyces ophidiicola]
MDSDGRGTDAPNENYATSSRAASVSLRTSKQMRIIISANDQSNSATIAASASERKIEAIDERLSGIERLLQDLALSIPTSTKSHSSPPHSASSSRQTDSTRLRPTIQEPEATTPSAHFEGESALSTHSVLASAIFEKQMGSSPNIEQNPAMKQALSSLRDIVETQTRPSPSIHTLRFPSQKPGNKLDLSQLELPPLDVVLSMLRLSKGHYPVFFLTLPLMDLPYFTQLCKDLYFCTEEYSSAQFATVNCILSYLFREYTYYGENDSLKDKFEEYSDLCKLNFETVISTFDLFVEPSYDNILALALGAFHATELSKISLCWNFTAVAARMCQSLGYHRASIKKDGNGEDSVNITLKKGVFWFIYLMDKNMSLCLGRTSTLQDYDISVEYPDLPIDSGVRPWRILYESWLDLSRIVGRVYEHLFSAQALCDSAASRLKKARALEEEIKNWRSEFTRCDLGLAHHSFFFQWMGPSADLSYYLLLTLVYRVLPPTQPPETPSGLSIGCVEAARNAMQLHQQVMLAFNEKDTYILKGYVDWTLLQCPFVPFLVIFCHIVASGDLDDLRLLGDVATNLQSAGKVSEGAERLYRLCMVFYQVAKVYVNAKLLEAENGNELQDCQLAVNPGNQFDSYLNALGLGPPLAPFIPKGITDVGGNNEEDPLQGLFDIDMAQSLEDWYSGNRHMMGLLESDL